MTWKFSDHVRCACKGQDGKLLGQECPQLWRRDGSWNTRHGSAGFAGRLPTSAGTKQFKKFGYPSRRAAQAAAEHVGKLLDLAQNQTDHGRIGDMVRATKQGAPLPSVEEVRRRLGLGLDPGQEGLSTGEWLDTWLAGKLRTKRESTCRGYEMHIRTWLKPQLGHLPLERLNAGHIEELFITIRKVNAEVARQRAAGVAPMDVRIDDDVRGQSRQCGPTTQLRIFATLRAALNAAAKQRKINWNPCTGVELEHPERAERQRWTPEEAAQFIDFTADDEMGLMFRTAVLRADRAWQDNDLVFCQRDGTPWKPDHVSKRFKRLAALAGVPVITLHEGGRHTGNSLMQDAGVDQELRMREVGHADRSVNDRYTHPLEQAHLAAAEQTATLLRKARDARKAS